MFQSSLARRGYLKPLFVCVRWTFRISDLMNISVDMQHDVCLYNNITHAQKLAKRFLRINARKCDRIYIWYVM